MPELNNPEKMSGKIVSNLLYYQTNYFVSFLTIFLLVFFFVPWKMLYIIILLALGEILKRIKRPKNVICLVFGAQHYMSLHHVHVKVWKKNHPTAVMTATFIIGTFFIYQVISNTEIHFSWLKFRKIVSLSLLWQYLSLAGLLSSSGVSSFQFCS